MSGEKHGGDRWAEQARNVHPDPPQDHREPHLGPEGSGKGSKADLTRLLLGYLALHGDWRETTVNTNAWGERGPQRWEFQPCSCPLCQEAVTLVGHPERPNG